MIRLNAGAAAARNAKIARSKRMPSQASIDEIKAAVAAVRAKPDLCSPWRCVEDLTPGETCAYWQEP